MLKQRWILVANWRRKINPDSTLKQLPFYKHRKIIKEQSGHRGKNRGTNWTNLMGAKFKSRMYIDKKLES